MQVTMQVSSRGSYFMHTAPAPGKQCWTHAATAGQAAAAAVIIKMLTLSIIRASPSSSSPTQSAMMTRLCVACIADHQVN